MMHLITYSINPKRDITDLIGAITQAGYWARINDEAWIIVNNDNSLQLYRRLQGHFRPGDTFLITEILREGGLPTGALSPEVWAWINGWKTTAGGARSVFETASTLPYPVPPPWQSLPPLAPPRPPPS
jgi:hypothetical protein